MTEERHQLLAVIELGTTSIRMVVGESPRAGHIHVLDEFQRAISLGRDTFTSGRILPATIEQCIASLRSFRQALKEYGIEEDRCIRAVATSAVREAANRDAFLDRILISTGFAVEIMDQAEVNRLIYRAVQPQLSKKPFYKKSDILVVEVGGGSTETLVFRKGKVSASHMYRLGSLRLRTLLEDVHAPRARFEQVMRGDMTQTIEQIGHTIESASSVRMLLLGSEARFARTHLHTSWDQNTIETLRVAELRKLTKEVLAKTVDETARDYSLTYPEAETLGPTLSIYLTIAKTLKVKDLLIGDATLRTGILMEMATGEQWTAEFKSQVINSAMAIARNYSVDLRHARHVARYAQQIAEEIREYFTISEREMVVLRVASLLHETGLAINPASHHKHSRYLIMNSDIFGLAQHDIDLAAMVARYHRGATPKPGHEDYASLPRADRITVSKLSAILRVANALDRLRPRRPMKLKMHIDDDFFIIETVDGVDLSLVQQRLQERSELFKTIFGKKVSAKTG